MLISDINPDFSSPLKAQNQTQLDRSTLEAVKKSLTIYLRKWKSLKTGRHGSRPTDKICKDNYCSKCQLNYQDQFGTNWNVTMTLNRCRFALSAPFHPLLLVLHVSVDYTLTAVSLSHIWPFGRFYFRNIFRVSTCAVLVVVFVEFKKNGGWNHQEIPERGCGRMSNDWKPLAQAAKPLEQRNTSSHKKAWYKFDLSLKLPISIV